MNCWFCQGDMVWQGDFSFEDYSIEDKKSDGVVALLICGKCNATAKFYSKSKCEDENSKKGKEKKCWNM